MPTVYPACLASRVLGQVVEIPRRPKVSELQETRIQDIVQAKAYDLSSETQDALNDIAQQLASILNPSAEPDDQKVCIYAVELF